MQPNSFYKWGIPESPPLKKGDFQSKVAKFSFILYRSYDVRIKGHIFQDFLFLSPVIVIIASQYYLGLIVKEEKSLA